jgi:hypothetical protein
MSYKVNKRGFSIMELLAASSLSFLVFGLALSAAIWGKRVLSRDLERTRLMQSMRSGIELISLDARILGENLPENFPALEIINGPTGEPDQVIVRRALIPESLTLCEKVIKGSDTNAVVFATEDGEVDTDLTSSSCIYDDPGQETNFSAWSSYRNENSGTIRGYLYDSLSHKGEFFTITGETDTGSSYQLDKSPSNWANDYSYITSSIYLIEEHRYRLLDGFLQLITDQDFAGAQNVLDGISDLQITALTNIGGTLTDLSPGDVNNWTDLTEINFSLTGRGKASGSEIVRRISGKFFPRNILSH